MFSVSGPGVAPVYGHGPVSAPEARQRHGAVSPSVRRSRFVPSPDEGKTRLALLPQLEEAVVPIRGRLSLGTSDPACCFARIPFVFLSVPAAKQRTRGKGSGAAFIEHAVRRETANAKST